jgi:hypothetical protein
MTGKEFIVWVEGYYGPYPEGQKRDIAEYIGRLCPAYLDSLRLALMHGFTSQYKKAPDIAIFEKYFADAIAYMPERPALEAPVDIKEYRNLVDLSDEARRRGIDPTVEGWMARLLFARISEAKVKKAVPV